LSRLKFGWAGTRECGGCGFFANALALDTASPMSGALPSCSAIVLTCSAKSRSFGSDPRRLTLLLQILIGIADISLLTRSPCQRAMSARHVDADSLDEPAIDSSPVGDRRARHVAQGFAKPRGLDRSAVFDAAMLIGLGQFNREELVAGACGGSGCSTWVLPFEAHRVFDPGCCG
jgi:hypothetical protein